MRDRIKEVGGNIKDDLADKFSRIKYEISGEANADRKEYIKQFEDTLRDTSYEQKKFLINIIEEARDDGRDFSITTYVKETWPEDYNKIMFLFGWLSDVTNNVKFNSETIHEYLEAEVSKHEKEIAIDTDIKEDKENSLNQISRLKGKLNDETEQAEKPDATVSAIIQGLKDLLNNPERKRQSKSIKEAIELINKNQDINEKDEFGYTILNLLVSAPRYTDILKIALADKKIDVNNKDWDALRLAAGNKNLEAFELLLQRPDLNVMLKDPMNPQNIFYRINNGPASQSLLSAFKENNIQKKMRKLVVQHPSYKAE